MILDCFYTDPPHQHEYPPDWVFGGADGLDPRADERWQPTTYVYYDKDLTILHVTQTPLCDDEAIDQFTLVAGWFRDANPNWIIVTRPDRTTETLPWNYDKSTDTAYPMEA